MWIVKIKRSIPAMQSRTGYPLLRSLSTRTSLFFLFQMTFTVTVGSLAHILIERSVERLTVGKTDHRTDFLHVLVRITLVCQQVHGFLHAIFVQQARIVHAETRIDYSRKVARVGLQLLG